MKRKGILALALIVALVMSLAACGGAKPASLTWTGLDAISVVKGDKVDPMQGITVSDSAKGDVTSSVVVLNDSHESILTELGVWDEFVEFNYNVSGVYTVYYRIESSGVTEVKKRDITVESKHNLGNGDFAMANNNGFVNWELKAPGGAATVSKFTDTDGKVKPKVEISNTGNGWWSLQYINTVNLVKGESYKITVKAKSDSGKSVAFGFEDSNNNFAMLQGVTTHKLSAESVTYESYYTADENYQNVKAVLYLGKMLATDTGAHSLVLDQINIEKVAKCPDVTFAGLGNLTLTSTQFDASTYNFMEGVTAMNGTTDLTSKIRIVGKVSDNVNEDTNYALAYVVDNENGPIAFAVRNVKVKVFKLNDYELVNGDFKQGLDFWVQDVNAENPGKAEFTTTEEGASIKIINPSSAGWHIQLHQDVKFAANVNYLVKVKAKASINRDVILELRGGQAAYTMALTPEFKEMEFAYTSKAAGGNGRVGFLLGGGGSAMNNSVITIESIQISLDPDQTQYAPHEMINPDFVYGMKNWGSEGPETTFTGAEGSVAVAFNQNTTSGEIWKMQLRQDGLAFKKDVKYKITIQAASTAERSIKLEIRANNADVMPAKDFNITTEKAAYTVEFTPSADVTGARVGLLLGGTNISGTTLTFYQFKIEIVPAV